MRKKQMLALFMSLSLLAQGMLFSGCGQKRIGNGRSAVYGDKRFKKTGSDV